MFFKCEERIRERYLDSPVSLGLSWWSPTEYAELNGISAQCLKIDLAPHRKRWSSHICTCVYLSYLDTYGYTELCRKYEHSKTFGIITSASSNIVWTPAENVENSAARSVGAGRAVVGAGEEVLCWDIKKGELVGRWKDSGCGAEVTSIAQSKADPDIHAVGYVQPLH
jgi:hypothetical protein